MVVIITVIKNNLINKNKNLNNENCSFWKKFQ